MTKLSSPATSEYNFQFTDIQKTGNSTLQSMLQNAADMDIVDVTAKVVYKDNEPQIVGASKALFTRREGYPSKRVTLARTHLFLFSLSCLQGGQGYPGRRVTLSAC